MSETSLATAAKIKWHKPVVPDLSGRDVCLFVSYAPDGFLKPHVQHYLAALRQHGFVVVAIAATDLAELTPPDLPIWLSLTDAFAMRENAGFDFGAWAAVLNTHPGIWGAASLTLANDSVFGPFDRFGEMIARIRNTSADVVSPVETLQIKRHFQSFFMTFRGAALRSAALRNFWADIRNIPDKTELIRRYEVELFSQCADAGLSIEFLFPLSGLPLARSRYRDIGIEHLNPTHHLWKELLDAGLPFIKIELLRDNPCRVGLKGWEAEVVRRGADTDRIQTFLRTSWRTRGYGPMPHDWRGDIKRKLRRIRRAIRSRLGLRSRRERIAGRRTS